VPYILVVGDKEISSAKLAIRERGSRDTKEMDENEFINLIKSSYPQIKI
jgi:threonyl-tRNA synthetase